MLVVAARATPSTAQESSPGQLSAINWTVSIASHRTQPPVALRVISPVHWKRG